MEVVVVQSEIRQFVLVLLLNSLKVSFSLLPKSFPKVLGVPTPATFPLEMITIRFAILYASSMSSVVIRIVVPFSLRCLRKNDNKSSLLCYTNFVCCGLNGIFYPVTLRSAQTCLLSSKSKSSVGSSKRST